MPLKASLSLGSGTDIKMAKSLRLKLVLGSLFGFLCIFNSQKSYAATVTCNFLSGTTYSTSGEWVKEDSDIMSIIQMFGAGGLKLPLKNSLLGNLDAKKYFLQARPNMGKFTFLVVLPALLGNL